MKQTLVGLMAAMAAVTGFGDLASGVKGNRTWNVGLVAEPLKGPVTVDGKLDDWDLSGQILTAQIGREAKYSVRTAAMWDETNLYLSFVWRDPTPMHSQLDPDKKAAKGWIDDAVQLRLKVGAEPAWVTIWCFDRQVQVFDIDYFMLPADTKGRHVTRASAPGSNQIPGGIEMMSCVSDDDAGFTMELKIPWTQLSLDTVKTMAAGDSFVMGLEFMWGNAAGDWPIYRTSDSYAGWEIQTSFFFKSPASWGEVKLAAQSTPNTRSYKPDAVAPYGCIPVRAKIPGGKEKFTLVLEDKATGERIRTVTGGHPVAEAKVGTDGDRDVVEVLWDGLDDLGRAVKPGTYRVMGLAMDHISLSYKSSFYNPGTPVWETPDGTGGWGADHSRPEFIVRAGTNVVLGTKFPEGGYGLWAIGPDGRKRWSEKRGARALAANDRHVYVLGGYYNEDEQLLFRVDPGTAKYVDVPDGKGGVLPCPYPLSSIPRIGKSRVLNIAVDPKDRQLALALEDGTTALLSTDSLRLVKVLNTAVRPTYPLGEDYRVKIFGVLTGVQHTPLAFDGRSLYYFQRRDGVFVAYDVMADTVRAIPLASAIGSPEALALSRDGQAVYVADNGADMQVKKFDLATGRLLGTYGKAGGRPRQGRYDKNGVLSVSSVCEDAAGDVWTVEDTEYPRRTSVWSGKDGSFVRDYIGTTFYCGSGTYLHDSDPTRAYAGGTEFRIDIDKGVYEPIQVLWNPKREKGRYTFEIPAGMHGIGPIFYSSASGEKREYLFLGHWGRGACWQLFMNDAGRWHPVSAVGTIGALLKETPVDQSLQVPTGAWAGLDPRDNYIWNDLDGDGYVTRDECEIVPIAEGDLPRSCGWGQRPDGATLDVWMQSTDKSMTMWKYAPARFLKNGQPIYARSALAKVGEHVSHEMPDIAPVTGEDTVVRFATEQKKMMILATDKQGRFKWRYRDWWHGVHGSHNSPDGNPNGRIFGAIMIVGCAEAGGDCGRVMMVRGNHLHDYWLTADGLYLDKVFKGVLDGELFPPTAAEARTMKFENLIGHGEPFMGWFAKQDDGRIRSIHGNFALACHICEVGGFESVKRFTSDDFTFTAADAVRCEEFGRQQDALRNAKPQPYRFGTWKTLEGEGVKVVYNLQKTPKGLVVTAKATGDASAWKNGGADFTKLFKTGDAFDVQLGNEKTPASEQRLLFAPFKDGTVVVQMRPVAPDAAKSDGATYESPVTSIRFDSVKVLPVEPKVTVTADGWSLSATIPWELVAVDPAKPIRGDVGVILSDPQGLHNAARIYFFNKRTGLVSDLPNEARLVPGAWGEFK